MPRAKAALDYAVDYAGRREAFGRPISDYQGVSFRLADVATKVRASWLPTLDAARRADAGLPFADQASMAKLFSAETAVLAAWAAVQTLGARGYSRDHPVEKWFRDAKFTEIEEGSSDSAPDHLKNGIPINRAYVTKLSAVQNAKLIATNQGGCVARLKRVDEEPIDSSQGEGYRLLGARLQELRRMRGLSLKEVATAVGVSSSFLSMVERGQTDLSLSRFSRLTEFYKVQPSELLIELNGQIEKPEIVSLEDYRTVARGPGVDYHVLQDENPQMIYVRLDPGARFSDMRAHRGTDFWYVLEGTADLVYGGETFRVKQGQTVRFSSTIPHGFANPYRGAAALVALCSVPLW